MEHLPAQINIAIHSHPNEEDYRYAQRAHKHWARLRRQRGSWGADILQAFLLLGFVGIIYAGLTANNWGLKPWLVTDPVWIIALGLLFPTIVALIAIMVAMNPVPKPHVGIDEWKFSPAGLAVQKNRRRGRSYWVSLITLSIALFVMIYLGRRRAHVSPPLGLHDPVTGHRAVSGLGLFVVAAGLACVMFAVLAKVLERNESKRLIAKFPELLRPQDWEFNEDGLIARSELREVLMKWGYIKKFLETPQIILIYPNETNYYLLPKSAFPSEMQIAEFMGLLMRKVPNGLMQTKIRHGFPVQPLQAVSSRVED